MSEETDSAIHRMPILEEGVEEIEEVSELTQLPMPPPRTTLSFRAPPPPVAPPPVPTRPGVVVVPPRVPAMPAAKLGMMTAKPPVVPRATAPMSIQIPRVTPPHPIPAVQVPVPEPHHEPEPTIDVEIEEAPVRATDRDLIPAPAALPIPEPPPREPTPAHGKPIVAPEAAATDVELEKAQDIAALTKDGIEVSAVAANIVIDQPLEAHLESPTVIDRALDELGDAGGEKRAETVAKELEATTDTADAAMLAYELGELYERRLADETRAVKAYGRALQLDPTLRANLWAIRRVFYRRGLWPNLVKLISAEAAYARDDHERADLLLERARIAGHHMDDSAEARAALEEATRIAPQHQAALLELERVLARAKEVPALLDVWERLAEAVEQPARKVAYWLEVGRGAAATEYSRAQAAFDQAATLAPAGPTAERIARERLRAADEHGTPEDVAAAIDTLSQLVLATFGPSGADGAADERPERANQLRRELVALRRRQAQIVRHDAPEKAWDVLQQAIAMSPGEPLVLSDLTELAEELGRYDDLAELVQSWQAVEGDPGRAMVLSIRRADALLRGGQRDQARALLASLEASAPGFIVLTSAAERDALGRGDSPDFPGDLARTYLTAAHAALLGSWLGPGQPPQADPNAAAALYVQAAELYAYEVAPQTDAALTLGAISPYDEARNALEKALEAVPGYPAAIEALTELDDTTGNVDSALARLRAQAEGAEGDQKRAILERAIRLARSHGDLEAVLDLERELVAVAPGDAALRWQLEATLSQLGRDDDRAQVLTELASTEPDATRRGTALFAAARLRERNGAVEQATDLYRQVLAVWPDDAFARESLIDLLRAQEKWIELVTERRTEARGLVDRAARRPLREAAWVLEVRLGDAASAAQVYDEWLVRIPDDRTALEGAARCRASFGDRLGEITARRTIAELDGTPEAHWLLGHALERAGQFDEAADVFRALAVRDEASVAATAASLALADLAAARSDTVMRVEATASLAARTSEPRLGAALAEDSGWMYALVLEDFERAQQSFAAAIQLEPTRRGALLGAALVAARRQDPAALSAAYDGLAASVQMPEAAAALHLRAAALAAAGGDLDLANQRVAAARAAAPDDTSALLVLAETGGLPQGEGADSPDEAAVVDPLLARAEVLELRSALADDPAARAAWELDRAEALELAGRLREAGLVIASVLESQSDDLRALEAMRRLAKRADDLQTWAQASYQLARVIGDRTAKLAYLRDAASVFEHDTGERNVAYLLATYKRLLQVDPGAPEIDRLLDLLRERTDTKGLVAVLSERLTWLEADGGDHREKLMVPLLLERATVLHGLGDQAAAMADLDALLDRSASNLEALRFRADLAMSAGDVETAVMLWRRALGIETRPQRRSELELQLAQVLAENINDVAGAIENLERVVEATPEDAQLHERLLGLCLRASDWERATRELRALARLRVTPQEKAREELRLGLMLRDRLNDRTGARLALDRARTLDPLNLDVVRELAELLEPAARVQVLAGTAGSFRGSIQQNPKSAVLYERLAQVTGWQSDVDARWLALVGLEALGLPSVDQRQVLAQGRAKLSAPQRLRLDEASRAAIRGPNLGALGDLWRAIAPAVKVATGLDAGKLGFGRGDKIAVKKLGDRYEPLASALACFGIDEAEIYVSANRNGIARAVAGEPAALCIGADVAGANQPVLRWMLGRAVAVLAEGVMGLADLRDGELGWTIAAALRALDIAIPPVLASEIAGEDASIAERSKVLKKEMSRKAKAIVQQIAQTKTAELGGVDRFRRNALAIGHRAGLLWCGDLAIAHAQLDVGRGGKSLIDSLPALDLTAWSVSDEHGRLRDRLGVSLKGAR